GGSDHGRWQQRRSMDCCRAERSPVRGRNWGRTSGEREAESGKRKAESGKREAGSGKREAGGTKHAKPKVETCARIARALGTDITSRLPPPASRLPASRFPLLPS